MVTAAKGPLRVAHRVERGPNGTTATETWEIDGVDAGVDPDAILWEAMNDPLVPQPGDAHPSIPGLVVIDQTSEPHTARGALINVEYAVPNPEQNLAADPTPWLVEYATSSTTEETNKDRDGNAMEHRYIPSGGGVFVDHFPRAQLSRPMLRALARRRQTASPTTFIAQYYEKVNDAPWNGYPKRSWLVDNIDTRRIGTSNAWLVTMSLLHSREAWGHMLRAEYWNFGRLPDDATEPSDFDVNDGNGIAYFNLFDEVDFAGLGLTLP